MIVQERETICWDCGREDQQLHPISVNGTEWGSIVWLCDDCAAELARDLAEAARLREEEKGRQT